MSRIRSSLIRCPKCNKLLKYSRKSIENYLVNNEKITCSNNCGYIFSKVKSEKIWKTYSNKKMVSNL
jgi:uncharacterized C2H2 Zn-finger protein